MSDPTRLEQAIAALLPYRELIDSGAPVVVELHFHPDEIKLKLVRWETTRVT